MKLSHFAILALVLVMTVLGEVRVSRAAVNCTPTELAPCFPAIISQESPTAECCSELREQRPCLCGYLQDPNLKQYINSPNARRVAGQCGVPTPKCY